MFCFKCGTKAIDGAVFCQKCGAKLIQDNREAQRSALAPKRESEEMAILSAEATSEPEQKSAKEEELLPEGEPIQILSSEPIERSAVPVESTVVSSSEPAGTSTAPIELAQAPLSGSVGTSVSSREPIVETAQDVNIQEESSPMSGSDADIYALVKENIGMCPAIKSAKQFKKGIRLHGKIYSHSVRLVTVHAVQARLRSVLAFPFSILYGLLVGLLCSIIGIIFQELIKYGSICREYYHGILFSLCCLVAGAIVLIHTLVGRKEKGAVENYVREIVESKQIYLSERKWVGQPTKKIVAAVVLVMAGIIVLPLSIPEPVEYPDELLFDGLPAVRFLEMTQKDIEAEYGEEDFISKNRMTAGDYYNYHDGFGHVTYSKETGKVIYIEFTGSRCAYNRKNLEKSMERVLDILDDGYWVNPMRLSSGVYGSMHSGFYYDDGVYFGDTLGAMELLAQQEFEDNRDYNYRFYTLRVWGEIQEDYSIRFREMKDDYEIALITADWKNYDEPNELYYVCLYTDEWVETVNAAVSLKQTVMEGNTSTADDSVFGEALMQLIMSNMLPDGNIANDLDGKVDGIYDRFAICDIDQDGEKELLVNISSGSMSVAGIYIYEVNASHTGLEYVWSFATDVTFYDTGFVKEEWAYNQGLADNFWPYNIYQRTNEGYSVIGSVDAWEKAYMESDFGGNPFPDEVDLNGNGIIYFISGKNGIDYDNPVDDAEYKEYEKKFLGSADDLYVPWQSLELDNVEATTGIGE